eukprot:4072038-Amphidinium_carterae.1
MKQKKSSGVVYDVPLMRPIASKCLNLCKLSLQLPKMHASIVCVCDFAGYRKLLSSLVLNSDKNKAHKGIVHRGFAPNTAIPSDEKSLKFPEKQV